MPKPGAIRTSATTINNRGEVAGNYGGSSGSHGFVYDAGKFTTLNAPGSRDLD